MIQINPELCIGCGQCVENCHSHNITLYGKNAQCLGDCFYCGQCVAICPKNAISIPSYDMKDIVEYNKHDFNISPDVLLNTIKFRRSIRDFKNTELSSQNIQTIIQAGRYTATASNRQDCRFIFIQDRLTEFKQLVWAGIEEQLSTANSPLEELRNIFLMKKNEADNDKLFFNAPSVLIIAADITEDAILAAQNIELIAHTMGLGVLFDGWLTLALSHIPDIDQYLHIENKHICITMLLGHPSVHFLRTAPRKKADVILL